MSVVSVGVYARDLYMFCLRLPKTGETVNSHEYAESHGGKAANQAVAAARLGARTALITRLGKDSIGQIAYDLFQNENLDVSQIIMDDAVGTGASFIILDQKGLQLITNYAGASARLNLKDIERAQPVLQAASTLLLQGEISAEISLFAAKLAGAKTLVILDPSPVEVFSGIKRFENVDILTPNEQEAELLTGRSNPDAAMIAELTGVPTIVITRGADGAEVFHRGKTTHVPSPRVEVVDTTGAGDAFNGAMAAGLDRGLDLNTAIEHACRCASFSVGRRFCIPSFPTLRDIPWE